MRLLYKTGAMESLRKWFYKPKRDDRSLLAQFFFADETLNMVAAELDSFDGREDPERCSTLVNQLRHAQEHVLNITGQIMDQLLGSERVARGFRVKFPEDVLQDNLAGQLWFGAECLAAGSSIMNREEESAAMRPLAKALTRSLETVRALLRDHCLRCNQHGATLHACSEILHESLKIFDRLFAEFELCYVSAMVPVKSPREFMVQQHICVLFSETLQRARRIGLLTQDQVDDYDPALMFAIPRLAIVSGLLIFSNGPLSIDKSPADQMSDMFRPFRTLLYKIRELLWTLDRRELYLLEKLLCTNEDIANIRSSVDMSHNDGTLPMNMDGSCYPDISEFVTRFYSDFSHCKDMMMLNQMAGEWGAPSNSNALSTQLGKKIDDSASSINEGDYLPDNMEIFTPILDGMRRLNEVSLMDDVVANYPNESKIIKETERVTNSTVIDNDSNLQESSVDEPRVNMENQPAALHSSGGGEHHIKLNVEYVDSNDANCETKDAKVSDTLEESLTLTLTRMESRSSSRSLGSRKSSRNESSASGASHTSDFMIRNLSSNGLSMFDPLAGSSTGTININPVASDNNVLLPDQLLVSNLSEQVSEIADKLSSITYENSDNTVCLMDTSISNLLQDQVYSFSTNDVSNLVSDRESSINFPITRDNVNFSPGRSEKVLSQLANMPSTSHGYLIPNAIGQEPAILTSLSNNNSVIFDEDPLLNPINNPMMMSQQSVNLANMESEMFGDSISVANANLSSLLLTSDEFQNRFLAQGTSEIDVLADKLQDETFASATSNYNEASFYSAVDVTASEKAIDYSGQNSTGARARFLIGYESDSNEPTPGDSGICTENTSLDRSPDSEVKDLSNTSNSKECITVPNANDQDPDDRCNLRIETCYNHYMDLNCSLSNENNSNKSLIDAPPTNRLRSSFSSNGKGGVTINITDCPTDGTPRIINSLRLNYSENSGSMQKNEAGPSHCIMQSPEFVSSLSGDIENSDISCNDIEPSNSKITIAIADLPEVINNYCDINSCSDNFDEGKAAPNEDTNLARATDSSILDSDVNDNCSIKNDNCDSNVSVLDSANDNDAYRTENAVVESSANIEIISTETETSLNSNTTIVNEASSSESVENNNVSVGVLNQRKLKKSPKNKKKGSRKSKLWSPGQGTGDSRGSEQPSPMRLNLEQLVDQGGGSCSSQSSVTSSFHSECADDEEIALALQAQEFASRHCTRAKFRSSEDLIHRLFVCIAGVADQLQTNFASDLRNILKSVFLMNQTQEIEEPEPVEEEPETKEPVDGESSTSRKNKSSDTIEYEVSESEVLTNGDSFDSIYLAEEVYADNIDNATNSDNNSPTSQRSLQSSRLSQAGATEDAQNDINQRRNSQSGRRHPRNSSDSRAPSRRNTINTVLAETRRRIQSSTEELNRDSRLSDGDSDTMDRITVNDDDNRTCFIDNGGSTRSSLSDSSHATGNPQQDQSRDIDKDPDSSNLTTEETVTIYRLNPPLSDDPVPLEHSPRSGRNNVNSRDARGSSDNTNSRDRSVRSQSVCGNTVERAPEWVPDIAAPDCMRCGSHFTAFRRRHHCRNCGKVFCASCSANSVPLPRFGQMKPVRVCEECFQTLAKRSCAARQIIPGTQSGRHANYTHR